MINTIDRWILSGVQKFSDWIHDWTSVTNFEIARVVLSLGTIYATAVHSWVTYALPEIMLATILNLTVQTIFFFYLLRLFVEAELLQSFPMDRLGTWRWMLTALEILLIVISVITANSDTDHLPDQRLTKIQESLYVHVGKAFLLFSLISLHFASCKTPPRKKCKVKKAAEKLAEKAAQVIAPRPAIPA